MNIYEMVSKLKRNREKFPATASLLEHFILLESAAAILERYGNVFWSHYERILSDILHLEEVHLEALPSYFAGLYERFSDIPHRREFKSFSEVHRSVYDHRDYSLMEHYFYLLPHGFTRLRITLDWAKKIKSKITLCDLGCGPGVILSTVLSKNPAWQGIGIDIGNYTVRHAQNLLKVRNIDKRAMIIRADIRYTTLKDSSVDLVIASEVIEHVPDPERVLIEIHRIIRKDGKIILTAPVRLPWGLHLTIFQDEKEIQELYKRCGFSILTFKTEDFGGNSKLTYALCKPDN